MSLLFLFYLKYWKGKIWIHHILFMRLRQKAIMSLAFYVFHFCTNEIPLKNLTIQCTLYYYNHLKVWILYIINFMGNNLAKFGWFLWVKQNAHNFPHCMKKTKPVLAFNLQSVATKVVYLISCFKNCTIFGISAKMNINFVYFNIHQWIMWGVYCS